MVQGHVILAENTVGVVYDSQPRHNVIEFDLKIFKILPIPQVGRICACGPFGKRDLSLFHHFLRCLPVHGVGPGGAVVGGSG